MRKECAKDWQSAQIRWSTQCVGNTQKTSGVRNICAQDWRNAQKLRKVYAKDCGVHVLAESAALWRNSHFLRIYNCGVQI
jgi:hypothetical protein